MTTVSEQSHAAAAMTADRALIDALQGGTRGMREAGETYLPKRPLESSEDYKARLGMATLFPALSETIAAMTGRVFARPLVIGDNVPEWMTRDVLPDIDRQGRNLHVFARDWFAQALGYGISHCLVESPRAHGVRTQADQRRANVRPYAIQIAPQRILGWRTDADGVLTQVRIRFERDEHDGEFGARTIDQIRVYEIGRVRTYEKVKDSWVVVDDVPLPLARIPLVTLYTNRTGMLTATPPLRELAFLNAKHWRMQSGNDTLVDTASVPILAVAGVQEGDNIVIGAKHAVRLPPGGSLQYVEHTGAAIGAGREALRALEDAMRQAGAKLVQPDKATKTATQAAEDASRENSALGAMCRGFQDTVNDLLDLIAEWRGEESGGTVQAQPNLDVDPSPNESMNVLLALRNGGALSDSTLFAETKRRGLVAEDVDWEDERERIAAQGMA